MIARHSIVDYYTYLTSFQQTFNADQINVTAFNNGKRMWNNNVGRRLPPVRRTRYNVRRVGNGGVFAGNNRGRYPPPAGNSQAGNNEPRTAERWGRRRVNG